MAEGTEQCSQCGTVAESFLGKVDDSDGLWYCQDCWAAMGVDIDAPEPEPVLPESLKLKPKSPTPEEYKLSERDKEILSIEKKAKKQTEKQLTVCKIGDRVQVKGQKGRGFVKFVGSVSNKPGTYVGIQLDNPEGKNDGTAFGKRYFKAESKHGLFVPIDKVTVRSVFDEMGMALGDVVDVPHLKCDGEIKFMGGVDWSPGVFIGLELTKAKGHHDGTQQGRRYFAARPNHGIILKHSDVQRKNNALSKIILSKESDLKGSKDGGNIAIGDLIYVPIYGAGKVGNVSDDSVGVILDQPFGKHDGTVDGQRKFECKPNHGLSIGMDNAREYRRMLSLLTDRMVHLPSQHLFAQKQSDEFSKHSMRICGMIMDMSAARNSGSVFALINRAIHSKDQRLLKHASNLAREAGIPDSAPKLAEMRRLIKEDEDQNEEVRVKQVTPVYSTTPSISTSMSSNQAKIITEAEMNPYHSNDNVDLKVHKKSVKSRAKPNVFRIVEFLYLMQTLIGSSFIAMLIVDSAWAGFPLLLCVFSVSLLILLDFLTLYYLPFTKSLVQLIYAVNLCLSVMIIQTICSGFGTAIIIPGIICCVTFLLKCLLIMRYKRKLIGKE